MQMETIRPIRVLAVDDSAVMRGVLRTLFQTHGQKRSSDLPAMELCGVVEDGVECLAAVIRLRPDVVVLDLEMPRMHGLDVLERLRLEEPGLPVIMCSAYTQRGARATLDALAMGAADYVMKPSEQSDPATAMKTLASQLLPKIAALAGAGFEVLSGVRGKTTRQEIAESKLSQGLAAARPSAAGGTGEAKVEIVVIGVSTGGPTALEAVLHKLAEDFPVPVMIVQHMPKLFTGELAERLNRRCALRVREAHEGAEVAPGTVWLAPGDAHMEVAEAINGAAAADRRGVVRRTKVHLHQQQSLNHCKPSADYLFSSAAKLYGAGTLALVMTGMGSDGLAGARHVHEAGGVVLTQDEATSAVWGMPGRVFEAGLSREPLPLDALADELTRRVNAGRGGRAGRDPSAITTLPLRQNGNAASAPQVEVVHGLL
jgi:two-component system, chemotaxis family, protein-glutamate methylesterase/glutaminase